MDAEIQLLKKGFNYDSLEVIVDGENTAYVFNNFYIGDRYAEGCTKLFGTYVPMYPISHYFHLIKEGFGSFLYYKEKFDYSAKILWLNLVWHGPDFHNVSSVVKELEYLIKSKYDVYEIDFEYINGYKNLFIEKLVILYDVGQFFVNTSFPNFDQSNNANNIVVRKAFAHMMKEDASKPKKIFITRKPVSRYLEKNKDFSSISRYTPEWIDDCIEKYFIKKGYEIIDLSGMSISEQISYFYNASHVAGQMGAGFINGIFSKPGTKFECIKIHSWFYYPYENDISKVIDAEYRILNLPDVSEIVSEEQIISHLEGYGI